MGSSVPIARGQGIADADGNCTITFPSPSIAAAWQGVVSVPASSSSAVWTVSVNDDPIGVLVGQAGFGPLQVAGSDTLSLSTAQAVPATTYQAVLVGLLVPPATPAPIPTPFSALSIVAMDALPIGAIFAWPGSLLPIISGMTLAFLDGAAISRTTYASLFSLVGVEYGAGDGSTTFNLPNMSGRVPLGADASYPLASTGGASSVQLTSGMLPATAVTIDDPGHPHGYTDPTHDHYPTPGYNTPVEATSTIGLATPGGGNVTFVSENTSSTATGITINSNTTGITASFGSASPAPLPVLNPYLALNWVIRIA